MKRPKCNISSLPDAQRKACPSSNAFVRASYFECFQAPSASIENNRLSERLVMQLTKEYGKIPLAISAFATGSSIMFLFLFYFDALSATDLGIEIPALSNCNKLAISVLHSIVIVYNTTAYGLVLLCLITSILFYVYDRKLFLFNLIVDVIFIGPMLAIIDSSVLVITPTSLGSICQSSVQSGMLLLQYALFFASTYFLLGNFVLFCRRNLTSKGKK
jgi:hypothetical protein